MWPLRSLAWLSVVLGGALFLYAVDRHRAFLHDDAYITLRYARNLAEGSGLTWNPGERVEGYTSFLASALIAVLGRMGVNFVTAARGLNFAALLGLASLLYLRRRWGAGPRKALPLAFAIPVMLVLSAHPLSIWALGALEGPVYALTVTLSVTLVMDLLTPGASPLRHLAAGLCLALTTLTRPDGIIFVLIAFAFLLVVGLRSEGGERAGHWRGLSHFGAGVAGPLVIHGLWRFAYYGAWLPNTFHAKLIGVPSGSLAGGFGYALEFSTTPPFWPLLALLGFGILAASRRDRLHALFLFSCIVAYLSFVVIAGGDHMPAMRLMLPLIPLCALTLGLGLDRMIGERSLRLGLVCTIASFALGLWQISYFPPQPGDPAARIGTRVGQHIARHWEPGRLIALATAGSIPFYAPENRYIDTLGLNDPVISRRKIEAYVTEAQKMPGHAKGDGQYLLARNPDVIILGPAYGTQASSPWFLSDFELNQTSEFHERYRLVSERVEGVRRPFLYYERR
jgi:hypothetical protein